MKKADYIISIIASIVISLIFIPIKVINTGKLFYGRTTVWNYLFVNDDVCTNCHNYKVSWTYLIIQFITIFIVCIFLLKLIDKKKGKN